MADEADSAQIITDRYLAQSLKAAKGDGTGAGAIYCEDCGDQIPDARKKAVPWCTRCISCQEEYEGVL